MWTVSEEPYKNHVEVDICIKQGENFLCSAIWVLGLGFRIAGCIRFGVCGFMI